MENASKAVIIAGGFFIAVLVISVCMYMYTSFSEVYSDSLLMHELEEIEAFNLYFVSFPSEISGYDAYNIIGKIKEVNANEDSITNISYSGVDRDKEFYFTENLKNNTYLYSYTKDSDGIISSVTIQRKM